MFFQLKWPRIKYWGFKKHAGKVRKISYFGSGQDSEPHILNSIRSSFPISVTVLVVIFTMLPGVQLGVVVLVGPR